MAVVTRNERKKRRCDALARLTSGQGVSQVTESLVRDYGITRRSANLDISWASTQIVKNLDKHEKKDLMAWLLTCLLYTSPSPRDLSTSRMPSSA